MRAHASERTRLARRPGIGIVLSFLLLAACTTDIVLVEPSEEEPQYGFVFVSAVDESGEWVTGTDLRFTEPNGTVTRGVIAYEKEFGTHGPPGTWTVGAQPPDGYAPAPEQENPVEVLVVDDSTSHVRFVLTDTTAAGG